MADRRTRSRGLPLDARAHCPHGRWGARRIRVDECEAAFCAETLYDLFLRTGRTPIPLAGTLVHRRAGRELTSWLRTENAIWRHGRVFFICPRCRHRRARLYMPVAAGAPLACGRCCGLTYASRTLYNYKDSLVGRGPLARLLAKTQRDRAMLATLRRQELRRTTARQRRRDRGGALRERTPLSERYHLKLEDRS
jgi:hypothetical protein